MQHRYPFPNTSGCSLMGRLVRQNVFFFLSDSTRVNHLICLKYQAKFLLPTPVVHFQLGWNWHNPISHWLPYKTRLFFLNQDLCAMHFLCARASLLTSRVTAVARGNYTVASHGSSSMESRGANSIATPAWTRSLVTDVRYRRASSLW